MRNGLPTSALTLGVALGLQTECSRLAGEEPEPGGQRWSMTEATAPDSQGGPTQADRADRTTDQSLDFGPVDPCPGTGCIIDSRGEVTRLSFESPGGPFNWESWLKRAEEFEAKRAAASAENERLRLQWIAEERERARDEAARQAELAAQSRGGWFDDYGWVLGGYGYAGGRRHRGEDRPKAHPKAESRPRPESANRTSLPAPGLTSPFPPPMTVIPSSSSRSFLP
jgi:hypothetical protein